MRPGDRLVLQVVSERQVDVRRTYCKKAMTITTWQYILGKIRRVLECEDWMFILNVEQYILGLRRKKTSRKQVMFIWMEFTVNAALISLSFLVSQTPKSWRWYWFGYWSRNRLLTSEQYGCQNHKARDDTTMLLIFIRRNIHSNRNECYFFSWNGESEVPWMVKAHVLISWHLLDMLRT